MRTEEMERTALNAQLGEFRRAVQSLEARLQVACAENDRLEGQLAKVQTERESAEQRLHIEEKEKELLRLSLQRIRFRSHSTIAEHGEELG